MMKKLEYLIFILISLAVLDLGLFFALGWYWSGFPWSPLGYENCGLEFILFPVIVWPCFVLAELIRLGLLFRWKFPSYVWWGPLILCGIAATACFCKSLTMGIYCVLLMLALPVMDFMALGSTVRRTGLKVSAAADNRLINNSVREDASSVTVCKEQSDAAYGQDNQVCASERRDTYRHRRKNHEQMKKMQQENP